MTTVPWKQDQLRSMIRVNKTGSKVTDMNNEKVYSCLCKLKNSLWVYGLVGLSPPSSGHQSPPSSGHQSPLLTFTSSASDSKSFLFRLDCSIFGEGNGNPLQYSCLENPMDRRAWWAAISGVTQSRTRLKRLHFHFSLSCSEEGNGNPLQCSCLDNPRDGGAWWAAISGVAWSRTWLKRLRSSSSSSSIFATNLPSMTVAWLAWLFSGFGISFPLPIISSINPLVWFVYRVPRLL